MTRDVVLQPLAIKGENGGAPATTQRATANAAARHSNATHHLAGRIGSTPGSSAIRPVIIPLSSF